MVELGQFSLLLAIFISAYAVLADVAGAWRKDQGLINSGRNATYAALICLTVAIAALLTLILNQDYSVKYVYDYTSIDLPLAYKFSALWAGAVGSLLVWLWMQVGFVTMAFGFSGTGRSAFGACARAVSNLVSVFFLVILIFDTNPFETLPVTPADGQGLNPLLQHPAMVLHPPVLFLGYAAFAIAFAWAIASLRWKDDLTPAPLLGRARRWTLIAWSFLTAGIVLGAWWAYEELGWGGYWAWDPVENSSLMPWITGTALVHCFRAYNIRGKTATWTVLLSLITFGLCIFSTFLTRSGLVASVHAFPDPGMSIWFVYLIALMTAITAVLMCIKYFRKGSQHHTISGPSQTFMVLNNYLMLALTFVILIGTLFPFLTQVAGKFIDLDQITLEPAFFNKVTSPLGIILLLFIALCPHLWTRGIKKSWRLYAAAATAVLALIAAIVAFIILIDSRPWSSLSPDDQSSIFAKTLAPVFFILSAFLLVTLTADAITFKYSMSKRTLSWLGSRLIHLGVALVFIGIAGSGGYGLDGQFAMKPGQEHLVRDYRIVYENLSEKKGSTYIAMVAEMSVYKGDKLIKTLRPAKAYYPSHEKSYSEVAVRRTLGGDLYLALTGVDPQSELINIRILVKPLINWIWIGSFLMIIGILPALGAVRSKESRDEK